MPRPRAVRPLLPILVAAALLGLPVTASAAMVHTFVNTTDLFPSGDANALFGPANEYPSTIEVEGIEGTVTKMTAEVVDLNSGKPEDIDMALENPDGEVTMLMSDACGATPLQNEDWTFDDDAPGLVAETSCTSGQAASSPKANGTSTCSTTTAQPSASEPAPGC